MITKTDFGIISLHQKKEAMIIMKL